MNIGKSIHGSIHGSINGSILISIGKLVSCWKSSAYVSLRPESLRNLIWNSAKKRIWEPVSNSVL
jgi:acetyl-CoA carboxylase alpha subunit